MKSLKVLLLAFLITFSVSEISVCEAQYIEILKGIGTAIKIGKSIRDQLMPLLEERNKTIDEHAVQNEKLDKITMKIESTEKEMMLNFKKLLKELEKIPGETVTQYTASKFERYMQTIDKTLGYLLSKKDRVNKGELVLDAHFKHDVDEYKTELDKYKNKIEVIMQQKGLSIDFLGQVKNKADVCADKMTQMQLLNSFRALYVDTISRYLMAQHIVISLWESSENTSHLDKKRELNSNVRADLLTYSQRFQQLMSKASREFQLCDKPTAEYILHNTGKQSTKCYKAGEGSQSNEIVELGPRFASDKHCWDYVSLRPATARAGYVVLGAKIERNLNILYVKVIEGKLLPNGRIDPKSITYNAGSEPGIGDRVVKVDFRYTIIDTTKTVAPDDRVVTGLAFAQTDDKHVYLDVQSTKVDLDKGILVENTARQESHREGSNQFQVRSFEERDNPIVRDSVGLQPVKSNEHVKFVVGGYIQVHPYIDLSDVYPTPLTLLSGASFYVRQVKGTQGYLSIRLYSFNITPHVTKVDFELNDDFADVLKAI